MIRPTTRETVADRLRALLADPTLDLAYPLGDGGGVIDARGSPIDPTPAAGRALTILRAPDGRPPYCSPP